MIKVYTDGSCHGNPGRGGWAFLLQFPDGEEVTNSGYCPWTTNNKMEMTAVIQALSSFSQTQKLTIYTDSMYVFKGITEWIVGWKKNGWKNSKKEQVKNKELWLELDHLSSKYDIEWVWVKAHNGHRENEIVDRLANQAIQD
jgi:ribonuclease HI